MEQFDFYKDTSVQEEDSNNEGLSQILPLAARMRPTCLDEYIGQEHILASDKLLHRAITADRFTSIILSGPPGTGKTSLAELIARTTNSEFIRLSGVSCSVADIRKQVKIAIERQMAVKRKTILFIDEIHRFNKAQQDSLLPDVENGTIRLVGATTHNPQFYIIGALLSRSLVFTLEPLSKEDIKVLLKRAITHENGFAS
jgi:putative ATPase